MTAYSIRKAIKDDVDLLADFAHQLNLYHGDSTKPDPDRLREGWGRFDAYLIGTDEEDVGFLAGFDTYQFHLAIVRFEIQNFYIKEQFRGLGAAQALMKAVMAIKYEQGIRKFSLGVENTNEAAIKFYEKIGFSKKPSDHLRYALVGSDLKSLLEEDE